MNDDEQFAASLRAQVTQVAPKIDVDVTRVVPAARRRRAAQVGGVTLALGLVLGGGAWAATTMERPGTALPGGSTMMAVEPSPEPSGPPVTTSDGDSLPGEPSNPVEGHLTPPPGWQDATYFHIVTRSEGSKQGEEHEDDSPFGMERWYGEGVAFELTQNGPALLNVLSYVQLGHTESTSVSLTWAELAELPTQPDALHDALLDTYEPAGQGEEAVLYAASSLVTGVAPASTELRAAAWALLTSMSAVDVEQNVQDSEGRAGTAATFELWDRTTTVIYDEGQNLPLESEESMGKLHSLRTFLRMEFVPLPDEVADSAIEIPDFTGMTREDAEVACLDKHLACTFEDTASDTAPEGTVVSSDPQAGALVTWGAPVTLLLSTGS